MLFKGINEDPVRLVARAFSVTAMDKDKRLAGLGVVIRNPKGGVIAAAVKTEKTDGNVERAEASAALWGLQVTLKTEAVSVVLESDS